MRPKAQRKSSGDGADRMRIFIYAAAALLSVLGIAETTYLTATHLAGAHIACGAADTCSKVLGSAYATVRGVPLALIGAIGYFAAFSCATLAAFGYGRAQIGLAIIVVAMFLTSLWLLYLQAFVLHAYCQYCLGSAALIFLLAGLVIAAPNEK